MTLQSISPEQSTVADQVDQARNAACELPNGFIEGVGKERSIAAGDIQTMSNIGTDLIGLERAQMAAGGDPLRELTHFLTIQDLQQLRLAEQYDLQ